MLKLASHSRSHPLTVVIATLVGPTLQDTIEKINQGSIVPAEILVCIPRQEFGRVAKFAVPNLTIVVTECRGQVAQRVVGFQRATHDIVMQLDDDMLLSFDCIERLLESLRAYGPKVAVAPLLVNAENGESVYKKPKRHKLVNQLYYWLMNGSDGYQVGKIDKVGSPVGVDPAVLDAEIFDVEWLPGGCVMHYKENVILENFYPFKGKAFYEDLIHSHHLKARGIRLIVNVQAVCGLDVIFSSSYSLREFVRNTIGDFKARRYFIKLSSRPSTRIYVYYLISITSYIGKRAKQTLTSFNKASVR